MRKSLILSLLFASVLALASWARADEPRPVISEYHLSPGAGAVDVVPGTGGAWVLETDPPGLAHVAAGAPPTGGVHLAQVTTTTLAAVTHTLTITFPPASLVVTAPVTVSAASARVVQPSPGITEYQWPTGTGWLAWPVTGTLTLTPDSVDGVAGLWAQRSPPLPGQVHRTWGFGEQRPASAGQPSLQSPRQDPGPWILGRPGDLARRAATDGQQPGPALSVAEGSVDFLDPATGIIISYHSSAFGWQPAHLNAALPGVVWGLTTEGAFVLDLDARQVTVFQADHEPTGLALARQSPTATTLWYGDYDTIVRWAYTATTGAQAAQAWVLPEARHPGELVHIAEQASPGGGEFWYLDSSANRLARFVPEPLPGIIVEYDLPGDLGTGLCYLEGQLPGQGWTLWLALGNLAGSAEIASFDPDTAVLTRYQSEGLPGFPAGGAPGWIAAGDQVYRLLSRHLLYLPLVGDAF